MVRRGSTVRVRQRALQKPRTWGFSVRVDLYFARRHAETNKVVIAGCDEAKLERAARRSRAASEQRRPLSQLPTDL
jgi:hypothetical protein